jgi:hypothetical protein
MYTQMNTKMRLNFSAEKMLGFSKEGFESTGSWASAVTANPTRDVYYHVYNATISGAQVSRVYQIVEMDQTVEFFDRAEVADAEKNYQRNKKAFAERKLFNGHRKCLLGTQHARDLKQKESKEDGAPSSVLALVQRAKAQEAVKVAKPKMETASWGDVEDDDASIFADFQAWKKAQDRGDGKKS